MAKNKFTKTAADRESELPELLETIALGIARELISGKAILKGEIDITTKCVVLKTLIAYRATDEKLELPAETGGAFDAYREKLSATNSGRNGNSDGRAPELRIVGGNTSNPSSDDEDADPAGEEGSGDDESAEADH